MARLDSDPEGSVRGPEAVRQKLIEAAIALMSERSPALITNKEIAAKAGVNHGQIHHYFSSKADLIAQAMTARAEWFIEEQLGDIDRMPLPIDTSYRFSVWRALAYLAVNAEEVDYVSPLIGRLVEAEAHRRGRSTSDPEVLADVAAVMALTYGWSVFEDHLLKSLDPYGVDPVELREGIAERSTRLVQ